MFLPAVLWAAAIWTSSAAAGAERLNVLLLVSDDCRAIQVIHDANWPGWGPGTGKRRLVTGRSVRSERYRYTKWGDGQDGVELYDQQSDPHEWHNLAGDPQSAPIVGQMKALLHAGWQAAKPE
jgi:hypothetical protein